MGVMPENSLEEPPGQRAASESKRTEDDKFPGGVRDSYPANNERSGTDRQGPGPTTGDPEGARKIRALPAELEEREVQKRVDTHVEPLDSTHDVRKLIYRQGDDRVNDAIKQQSYPGNT